MKRTLVTAVAAGFMLAASGMAHAQQDVRFVLDWAFQGQQSPYTIAVDDGTFEKLGLNVTVDRGIGSGDTVSKVASGAYDIGVADVYSMVRFLAENPGQKLIGVMATHDKSALSVATMKASGIDEPKELNGKRIAAPVGDASRQLFPLFAEVNGIDQASLEWINITPELREPMLIRGEADAITGHLTTILLNMRNIGVDLETINVMPYAEYGVDLYGHMIIVRPEYAEQNPEVVTNFLRGVVHGFNEMLRDPDAAVASIKARDPLINEEVEKARIEMTNTAAHITPQVLENGMSNVDMERLDRSLQAAAKAFGIAEAPKASEIYVDKYLPPREELKLIQ